MKQTLILLEENNKSDGNLRTKLRGRINIILFERYHSLYQKKDVILLLKQRETKQTRTTP